MKKRLLGVFVSVFTLVSCNGGSNSPQTMLPGTYNVTYSNGLIKAQSSTEGNSCVNSQSPEPGILTVSGLSGTGSYNPGDISPQPVYSGNFTNPINNLPNGKPCFTAPLDQSGEYPPLCDAITSNSYIEFVGCINYSNGISNIFKAQYYVYTTDTGTGKNLLVLSGQVTGSN